MYRPTTLESNMGAMSGCFSSCDKKDKEGITNKGDRISTLGVKYSEYRDVQSGKQSAEHPADWDGQSDEHDVIPANLFFWSDYHSDFDGTPNYKEIVDPKYDAILLKCATAPADWQVPDLRLPMASTYDLPDYYPSCSSNPMSLKTNSLPCIYTSSSTAAAGSEGWKKSTSLSDIAGGGKKRASIVDIKAGGKRSASDDDHCGYQQAYLKSVNVTYQTAVQVSWPQAAVLEEESTYSEYIPPGGADIRTKQSYVLAEKNTGTHPIPWELPEDEVMALRDTSQRYLMQFEYHPSVTRRYSCSSVRSDSYHPSTKSEETDGSTGGRSHSSTDRSAPLKETQPSIEKINNPDIEYFKLQFASLLEAVGPSHGDLDVTDRPWLYDGDDEDGCGYYPELLEDPQPRS